MESLVVRLDEAGINPFALVASSFLIGILGYMATSLIVYLYDRIVKMYSRHQTFLMYQKVAKFVSGFLVGGGLTYLASFVLTKNYVQLNYFLTGLSHALEQAIPAYVYNANNAHYTYIIMVRNLIHYARNYTQQQIQLQEAQQFQQQPQVEPAPMPNIWAQANAVVNGQIPPLHHFQVGEVPVPLQEDPVQFENFPLDNDADSVYSYMSNEEDVVDDSGSESEEENEESENSQGHSQEQDHDGIIELNLIEEDDNVLEQQVPPPPIEVFKEIIAV